MMSRFYLGLSGWSYKAVEGSFFPKSLRRDQHLHYLAQHFNSVEINASFYREQTPATYEKWKDTTPEGFVFAVKVSRAITHLKRMRSVQEDWSRFLKTTEPLAIKRGPFLLQFPPSFSGDDEDRTHMEKFLEFSRSERLRFAVEFRHRRCFETKMLDLLRRHQVALVAAHSSKYPAAPIFDVTPFLYFRFHGPRELFASNYSREDLKPWASLIVKCLREEKDVYVYFNNAVPVLAPANALVLRELVDARL